jgi:hypothetical protein
MNTEEKENSKSLDIFPTNDKKWFGFLKLFL